jgi:hypothetical protein
MDHTKPVVRKAGTTEIANHETKRNRETPALRKILDLTKDAFCKINWYYPGGREAFPSNSRLWTVDRYFPYAQGGPVLADLVQLEHKFEEAKVKAKFFAAKNIKYVAITQDGSMVDLTKEKLYP